MIKRTITISSPSHLSLKHRQLIIANKETDEKNSVPIEEIGTLILEHPHTTLTLKMLQYCMEMGAVVIVCNELHTPSGMLYPLEGHSTQGLRTREQASASIPTKKNVWKQLIESKISNQALVLKQRGHTIEYKRLKTLSQEVKSGDTDNREGVAARIYWTALLGEEFIRARDGKDPNPLFNYAYTILRATVTRALVGSGLSPKLGVQHKSQYNAFPLSDDVMEPYRPFADIAVMELVDIGEWTLTKETRRHLREIVIQDTLIGKVKRPLQTAVSTTTASLAEVFIGKRRSLVLPRIP